MEERSLHTGTWSVEHFLKVLCIWARAHVLTRKHAQGLRCLIDGSPAFPLLRMKYKSPPQQLAQRPPAEFKTHLGGFIGCEDISDTNRDHFLKEKEN